MATTSLPVRIKESVVVIETDTEEIPLTIFPNEVAERTAGIIDAIESIELKATSAQPYYEVKGTKRGTLFGLIPVTMTIDTDVDGRTGEVEVHKPWWSILVF